MKDTFDRDIKVGDLVAYATRNSCSAELSVGEVVGYAKCGTDRVRVRVFKSSTSAFTYGHKKRKWNAITKVWDTTVVREPKASYVATVGMPDRIIVINDADVPRS